MRGSDRWILIGAPEEIDERAVADGRLVGFEQPVEDARISAMIGTRGSVRRAPSYLGGPTFPRYLNREPSKTRLAHGGRAWLSPQDESAVGVPCENLAEADRVLQRLRGRDGVQDAGMRIMKDVILDQDWLKGEIDRRSATT